MIQMIRAFRLEGPIYGAPEEIRTPDPLVRSQVLYPAELRARRRQIILKPLPHYNKNFGGERGIRTLGEAINPTLP